MYLSAVVYCCCVLLSVVGCSCVLLCVVACYKGLLVAVCEQVLRGGEWLLGLPPQPGHVQRFCVILEVRLSLQRSQLFGLCVQLFLS
jgi:hypothetical protein